MRKDQFEYPFFISTEMGEWEGGWSAGQKKRDCLLIGTFTEQMVCTLIKINELYARNQPLSAIQFQMVILLDCIKKQRRYMRSCRKNYKNKTKNMQKEGNQNGKESYEGTHHRILDWIRKTISGLG